MKLILTEEPETIAQRLLDMYTLEELCEAMSITPQAMVEIMIEYNILTPAVLKDLGVLEDV